MKKLTLLTLATLISAQAMAADYVCKDAYETKINKLQSTMNKIESVAVPGLFGAMGVGGAIAVAGATVAALPIIFGPFVVGIGGMFVLDHKHQSLVEASSVIIESAESESESDAYASSLLYKYYLSVRIRELEIINDKRAKIGLPKLSLNEYLEQNPILDSQIGDDKIDTMMEVLIRKINKSTGRSYSYGEVETLVKALAMTNAFCPDNKPVGFRRLVKIVKKHL